MAAFSSRTKRFWRSCKLVEVHQVAVEIGAVHAGELHLAADRDAAGSAHPGAVHHDRIQADHGRNAEGPCDFAHAFIIGIGPMATTSRTFFSLASTSASACGHEAVASVTAIVGGDDQFVAALAELLFPEHQVAIAEADDGNGPVSRLLVRAQLGVDGRDTEAAAHQHHRAVQLADMARQAQRTDEIEDRVALA